MEDWQAVRAQRSKEHDIHCTRLSYTDTSAVFTVIGAQGDVYAVEVAEDLDLWPPTCECEDYVWRGPDFLCKHILYCLRLMGVEENALQELSWEPWDQETLLDFLCNALDVIGERSLGDCNAE